MADEWYYAHNANRLGPFSGQQLKNLAISGSILRTDIIWKQGVEKGILASKVKDLFSLPPVSANVAVVKVSALSNLPASIPVVEKILRVVESKLSAPAEVRPACQLASAVVVAAPTPMTQENTVATLCQPKTMPKPARKGRAVALKGADIVSQDGFKAKYRRKCTVCGQKDVAVQTIVITNRTTNAGYYCPKCRKRREVTIQCTSG